jgi:hypothetical protein
MRHVFDKSCTENQHLIFNNLFLENRDIYEIIWKNVVEPGRPQITIWRMRFVSRIPKATDTHSGYVILIAFPRNSVCKNLPHTSRERFCFAVRTEYLNKGLIWDSFSRGHPVVCKKIYIYYLYIYIYYICIYKISRTQQCFNALVATSFGHYDRHQAKGIRVQNYLQLSTIRALIYHIIDRKM